MGVTYVFGHVTLLLFPLHNFLPHHVAQSVRLYHPPRKFVKRVASMSTIPGFKDWRASEFQELKSSVPPVACSYNPTHLVLLVNGIFARYSSFRVICLGQEQATLLLVAGNR